MSRSDDETPSSLARFSCITGKISVDKAREIENIAKAIVEKDLPRRLSMLSVSGNDLSKHDYSGRKIGEKLNEILDMVMRGEIENTKEAIEKYL